MDNNLPDILNLSLEYFLLFLVFGFFFFKWFMQCPIVPLEKLLRFSKYVYHFIGSFNDFYFFV